MQSCKCDLRSRLQERYLPRDKPGWMKKSFEHIVRSTRLPKSANSLRNHEYI